MIDPLSNLPGYVLRRAATSAGTRLNEKLKPLGLRQADVSALVLIDANPGISSARLCDALGIQSANMAVLMGRLESSGMIVRQQIDGRSQSARLTAQGRAKLAEADCVIRDFEQQLVANVPEPQRAHILPVLLSIWRQF